MELLPQIKQRAKPHLLGVLRQLCDSEMPQPPPKARVSIYGSCLSNLSLGKGADVDLSLWIPEADQLRTAFQIGQIEANLYEKDMKRLVYQAYHKLRNLQQEFRGMQAITRARVPVIKGTYTFANNPYSPDGSIK